MLCFEEVLALEQKVMLVSRTHIVLRDDVPACKSTACIDKRSWLLCHKKKAKTVQYFV